jgi:hypothetical protein
MPSPYPLSFVFGAHLILPARCGQMCAKGPKQGREHMQEKKFWGQSGYFEKARRGYFFFALFHTQFAKEKKYSAPKKTDRQKKSPL